MDTEQQMNSVSGERLNKNSDHPYSVTSMTLADGRELIYFDDDSRARAVNHLHDSLAPGGFICLGHTESMSRISDRFAIRRFPDAIVYQRPPA